MVNCLWTIVGGIIINNEITLKDMKNTYSEKDRKFLKKLGENVRKYREQKEYSQEELAYQAGLDRTYISGIERGERNISVITLKKITDVLKIETHKILNGQNT
jgi:DNA-binding XRE family transcriptional regulator